MNFKLYKLKFLLYQAQLSPCIAASANTEKNQGQLVTGVICQADRGSVNYEVPCCDNLWSKSIKQVLFTVFFHTVLQTRHIVSKPGKNGRDRSLQFRFWSSCIRFFGQIVPKSQPFIQIPKCLYISKSSENEAISKALFPINPISNILLVFYHVDISRIFDIPFIHLS